MEVFYYCNQLSMSVCVVLGMKAVNLQSKKPSASK